MKKLTSNPPRRISKREYKYLLSFLAQLIVLAPNAVYNTKDMAKPVIKAAVNNKFIESVCNQMRKRGLVIPTGNDVFYNLTGKRDKSNILKISDVYKCLDSMMKRSFTKAKRHINFRVPLSIAIDFTDIPFYGKGIGELARWIIGCENKHGTNKCFRFITVAIVVKGRRFTMAALPVSVFDSTPELVEVLIRKVRKYIRIRYVFLDRGFYSVDVIKKLIELEVGFVIPIVKYKGKDMKDIRKLMRDNYYAGKFRFRYTLGDKYNSVTFTVVVLMGKEDVIGFATNTKLPAETIADWYSKRWGAETVYRVKNEFRARTCARKSGAVRLLLNMLSFVFYNIWVLVNISLRFTVGGGKHLKNDGSYVTAFELRKDIEELIDDG